MTCIPWTHTKIKTTSQHQPNLRVQKIQTSFSGRPLLGHAAERQLEFRLTDYFIGDIVIVQGDEGKPPFLGGLIGGDLDFRDRAVLAEVLLQVVLCGLFLDAPYKDLLHSLLGSTFRRVLVRR